MHVGQRDELDRLREALRHGEQATQEQIDGLCRTWQPRIDPARTGLARKDRELLVLVDDQGQAYRPERVAGVTTATL